MIEQIEKAILVTEILKKVKLSINNMFRKKSKNRIIKKLREKDSTTDFNIVFITEKSMYLKIDL